MAEVANDAVPIDAKAFWQALGQRAIGATVVTAESTGGPAGLLALSATHLTESPPTMMVSVSRRTSALTALRDAGHFAINFLPAGSETIADAFAGRTDAKGADRFASGDWGTLATGAPVLKTAVGAMDCAIEEILDRHETAIVIGRVVAVAAAHDRAPLIYFRGGFLK